MHQVRRPEVQRHGLEVVYQFEGFGGQVVVTKIWVVFHWLVGASDIEAESRGWAVVVVVDVREHVGGLVVVVLHWAPDHLHGFLVETFALVLVVDSCEEEGLHAHLAEH